MGKLCFTSQASTTKCGTSWQDSWAVDGQVCLRVCCIVVSSNFSRDRYQLSMINFPQNSRKRTVDLLVTSGLFQVAARPYRHGRSRKVPEEWI